MEEKKREKKEEQFLLDFKRCHEENDCLLIGSLQEG